MDFPLFYFNIQFNTLNYHLESIYYVNYHLDNYDIKYK